jgi:nicotinamide riboside transporter PnuC
MNTCGGDYTYPHIQSFCMIFFCVVLVFATLSGFWLIIDAIRERKANWVFGMVMVTLLFIACDVAFGWKVYTVYKTSGSMVAYYRTH